MTVAPLDKAREARLSGDYGAAELLCRRLLDKNPIDPYANGFLGQCLAEMGDAASAGRYIEMALGLAPKSAEVRLNAAIWRERSGDLAGAVREAVAAAELDPSKFEVMATLGNLMGKAGAFDKAVKALAEASRLNPSHPGAALLLAGACLETGDYAAARRALDLVDAAAPRLPQSLKLRANVARAAGDPRAMEAAAQSWMEVEPENDEPRAALAFALAEQGYYPRAAEAFRPLAEADPPRADALAAMGRYRLGARAVDDAKSWFARALAIDADCAEAHFGMARALTFTGDLAQAEAACRRAIAAAPSLVAAYGQLAEITRGRLSDGEIGRLRALAAAPETDGDARSAAFFAIGDALHQLKDRKGAFDAWSRANTLKRARDARAPTTAYDRRREQAYAKRLKMLFPKIEALCDAGDGAPVPIFIVGMPRSGTTLLESALDAHPLVAGGGELSALPFILKEVLALAPAHKGPIRLDDASRAALRAMYFRQAAHFGVRAAPFLADKQPANFQSIGLIRLLFPEAKIIHIRRAPMETGFSIFRRNFSRQWPFAHDLTTIGHYYGLYADLMAHWEAMHEDAIAFVQYEDLVADFEGHLRRLLERCGLPWDDSCLRFHEADRPVITFSAVQVREGPSKSHLGAAEPYLEFLEPLREALIAADVDLATGARVGQTARFSQEDFA